MAEFTVIEEQTIMQGLTEQQRLLFMSQFSSAKKDRNMVLIVSVIFGFFGLDRFMIGHFGWGILKLFTFGGLGILWLIDLFIIRGKVDELNRQKATEIAHGIRAMS